jgi:shikimate kinase
LTYKLKKSVVLVGMMGAGKTAVGRSIATRLGAKFVDLDDEIIKAANMKITEIFETYGEVFFRDKESKVLQRLLDREPIVLAAGGGTFISEENRRIILSKAHSIWLNSNCAILWERIKNNKNRPLLNQYDRFEKFKNLYDDRVRFYAEADISIVNNQNCSIDEIGKRTVDQFLSFINNNLE